MFMFMFYDGCYSCKDGIEGIDDVGFRYMFGRSVAEGMLFNCWYVFGLV